MNAELLSEDTDCPSSLFLKTMEQRTLSGPGTAPQRWELIAVSLTSGKRRIDSLPAEEILICKEPVDEIALLAEQLKELVDKQREQVLFEPSEPSFELSFTRTKRGGIQLEAWLDAGNGTTGIYTWDACGMRFMTNDANLQTFINQLAGM
jgi:hypothetical protein